jgi:PTH1 family peptidyl-tRNA hydrolase
VNARIELIVGLGNPGPQYENTRHNVGAWFIEELAKQENVVLRFETKFHGLFSSCKIADSECKLLFPSTFMNNSGQAVRAVVNFYKIPPEAILLAHDELDFAAGTVKLKFGGGLAGHNGLEDIAKALNTRQFYRLRFGIGRPQNKDVINYVLNNPSQSEKILIKEAISKAISAVPDLVSGQMAKAMQTING